MIELYLARRYLFRGRAKHISFIGVISCLGVVIGVATVIVAISIVNGIDGGLMERIMRFKYHLTIEAAEDDSLYRAKEVMKQWEEVEIASLSLQTQIFAKFDDAIIPLVVKGIDFSEKSELDFFYQYVKSDFNNEGFFAGEGLRRKFNLGERIEFYPLEKKLRLQEEKIRGFFSTGLYDIDNYYLIGDLEKTKELSPHCQFFLGVRIKEPFYADKIKQKIKQAFPEGLFVFTWIEQNEALFATLKLEKIAMFIILSLIILVASFSIFATSTVKVVEKTKEIGILKSIGFTNRKILTIFTLQGVILGFIGVIFGTCLGLGICLILEKYPFIRLPQEIFFTEYLPVAVNYGDIILIGALALCISFVSSLFPALRAARLSPCEALRYE
ncbi:MAG: ABC transporter permease [Candidatus Omnitrophica bacterium]|nr:ABC transporter permease [Candidatus Omnitrophota bacterium]MBU1523326.1 ABC transporter permease [Candidatus Omnitrophota bacterium]MBU2436795.1 ABC transporter permease [Candidatus Omnitrophota bacterium]